MKKHLVLYYSKTGNNQFLAQQSANALSADIMSIQPRFNNIAMQYLLSLMKINMGINISRQSLEPYEEIVIFGPIWGGLLLSPLRSAIQKCVAAGKRIHFATCCGSNDEEKDDKYGYEQVLQAARNAGGVLVKTTEAFPIVMVLTETEAKDPETVMNTRLSESNFKGKIKERFESFIQKINS